MISGVLKIKDGDLLALHAENSAQSTSFFATIPPERVGLNGEYDHHGLAKRVLDAFQQQYGSDELRSLKVKQRGAVVVLVGKVRTQALLIRLAQTALSMTGAVAVETHGVTVQEHREPLYTDSKLFASPAYFYGWGS
jgi:hypothetical protein